VANLLRPVAGVPARDGKSIMTEFYIRPDEMPPGNGYSHAVAFTGRTVVVSGQPVRPAISSWSVSRGGSRSGSAAGRAWEQPCHIVCCAN
jgi:hypothetical protein